MLREAIIAGSIISAGAQAAEPSPAVAGQQERVIKVGFLDTAVTNVMNLDSRTSIEYREFHRPNMKSGRWKMDNGADHSEVMANVFIKQVRSMDPSARINIYAANITEQHPTKRGGLLVNFDGAREALQWFSKQGVKVVMTTMVGKDSASMRLFMNEAARLKMTVFASAGNQVEKGVPSYPAAYPDAISIAGEGSSLALRNDPSVASWVNFAINGNIRINTEIGNEPTNSDGSSMAVARASAIGAFAVFRGKSFDRDTTLSVLKSISEPKSYSVKDAGSVSVSFIDYKTAGDRLAKIPDHAGAKSEVLNAQVAAAQMAAFGR